MKRFFSILGTLLAPALLIAFLDGCDLIGLNPPGAGGTEGGGGGGGTTVNKAPVAEAGPDQYGEPNVAVTFDGSISSDSDGTIVAYDWDFGDQTSHGSGVKPGHAYASAGTYTVTLNVTDDDGATATDTMTVRITTLTKVDVSADITAPTIWQSGTLYHVVGWPHIKSTLTIQPGVVVKFDLEGGMDVESSGLIDASAGTQSQPIIFTSIQDDSIAGDTDGRQVAPGPGDWYFINVYGAGCKFNNCVFRNGGGDWNYWAALTITGNTKSTSITNCTFADNILSLNAAGAGTSTTITGCTFYGNTGGSNGYLPLYICSNVSLDDSNRFPSGSDLPTGAVVNTYQGIGFWGDVTGATSWGATHAPYVPQGWPHVKSTLTIQAGVIVKFYLEEGMDVEATGHIDASAGTQGQPIIFTSIQDDSVGGDTDGKQVLPGPGDWYFINVYGAGCRLNNCVFRYGGGDWNYWGAVTITNSVTSTSITNCTFANDLLGLNASEAGANTTITGCTFYGNTGGSNGYLPLYVNSAINLDDTNLFPNGSSLPPGAVVNKYQGIGVEGDISANTSWAVTKAPLVALGNFTVRSAGVLTLASGGVFKFYGTSLSIEYGGTIANFGSVSFTSYLDDSATTGGGFDSDGVAVSPNPIDWDGIWWNNGTSWDRLCNTNIHYASKGAFVY